MRIEYKGINKEGSTYERNHRSALIWYNDESDKERYIARNISVYLKNVCGRKVCEDCGFVGIEVCDEADFNEVKEEYKKIKKNASDWYRAWYKQNNGEA